MKKFSKILSSALVVCMLVSCFAINAFAATQARTFTVKTDKADVELKAGDVVTVEVVADTLLHSWNAGYTLSFDPAVFTIDTASGGMGKPKKYVDVAWHNTIKDDTQVVGYFWGASRTSSEDATAGTIICAWSGNTDAGSGVLEEYNQTNYTIGKYYLTVIEGAKAGKTNITVTGETYGWKENSADAMTYVPATLTVAGEEDDTPAIDEVTGAGNTGIAVKEEVGNFKYDNAYAVEVGLTADVTGDVVGVEFVPAFMADSVKEGDIWQFAAETTTYSSTWLGKGGATLKAALINIPIELKDETFTIKARAFVKNGADKTYFGTIVEQEVTYTVD